MSDPSGTLATPIDVVERPDTERGLRALIALVAELEAERVVIGLPLTMRGEEGEQASRGREFRTARGDLSNEQLLAESEARLAEVQASRQRIVAAGDAERRRLERDLHDGAQQRLVALALQLRMIRSDIRRDPAQAEQMATTASEELAHSLQELRELARGIHPATLDQGLASALESLASRSTVATAVTYDAPEHVPKPVELAVYFVACEALANVGKYAQATAASLHLSRTAGGVAIEIADDGVGGADAALGSGLHGLADRVEALNGNLRVTSPPGAGTVITAELPCVS